MSESRTEADVWAIAGITELQRMRLAQSGYRIAPIERGAAVSTEADRRPCVRCGITMDPDEERKCSRSDFSLWCAPEPPE